MYINNYDIMHYMNYIRWYRNNKFVFLIYIIIQHMYIVLFKLYILNIIYMIYYNIVT